MGNTLTAVATTLFSAAQVVQDEPAGGLDAIDMDFDDQSVAKGDAVKVPIAGAQTEEDFTPAATSSSGADQVPTAPSITADYSKKVTRHLTGEEIRSLENAGTNQEWAKKWAMQAMRTIRNAAEVRLMDAIYQGASRAIGTADTTPFSSSIDLIAEARKELIVNGAPLSDPQLVIDSSAALNIMKLGIYQQAYAAGSDAERRTGTFRPQFGFNIRESAGIAAHTKGTGTGYLINNGSGEAIGQTTLTLDGGSGTMPAGDVITHASDANNKYVVNTALAASNDVVIGNPGLLVAAADNDAITIGENYTPNVAFERSAVVGIWRPPFFPPNPTHKYLKITDDHGKTYLMIEIAQYGQITWEIHALYGFKVVQSDYVINIMG